jgi:hypothetical protein
MIDTSSQPAPSLDTSYIRQKIEENKIQKSINDRKSQLSKVHHIKVEVKEFYMLFTSIEDSGSEYKMSKI